MTATTIATENHLREEILNILYAKNLNKPIWISVEEVFWTIDDFSVSEEQIKKTLKWLVERDKVISQSGKYQISQEEFLERSKKTSCKKVDRKSQIAFKKTDADSKKKHEVAPSTSSVKKNSAFWIGRVCFTACCAMIIIIAFIAYQESIASFRETTTGRQTFLFALLALVFLIAGIFFSKKT